MTVTAKRYSFDLYRIMDGGQNVGFTVKQANGKWSMNDLNGIRLDDMLYENPAHVAKCFNTVRLLTKGETLP